MENIPEKKWFNYFNNIRNKYNTRLSKSKAIVLFLDAKDSTKNHVNLFKGDDNDFFNVLQEAAIYFTKKYNCIALAGTDEISLIIEDTDRFIDTINNEKKFRTHDTVSVFSQYFFEFFNERYKGKIFWHCNCFNIQKEKILSYLKYKSAGILKGSTAYFLKHKGVKNPYGIKLEEKLKIFATYEDSNIIDDYKEGILYLSGSRIDIEEYFKGNVVKISKSDSNSSDNFISLDDFDKLF